MHNLPICKLPAEFILARKQCSLEEEGWGCFNLKGVDKIWGQILLIFQHGKGCKPESLWHSM